MLATYLLASTLPVLESYWIFKDNPPEQNSHIIGFAPLVGCEDKDTRNSIIYGKKHRAIQLYNARIVGVGRRTNGSLSFWGFVQYLGQQGLSPSQGTHGIV